MRLPDLWTPPLLWDLVATAGGTLTAAGLWWIYPPAALIATGGGLIALAVWGARLWARTPHNKKGPDDGAADDVV